jgi:hypothetical protein
MLLVYRAGRHVAAYSIALEIDATGALLNRRDPLGRAKDAISAYDCVLMIAPGQTQVAARRAMLDRQRNRADQ